MARRIQLGMRVHSIIPAPAGRGSVMMIPDRGRRAAWLFFVGLLACEAGCGGGCGAKTKAPPLAASDEAESNDPVVEAPPAAPGLPRTPEQLAADTVTSYFAAMQRGDL